MGVLGGIEATAVGEYDGMEFFVCSFSCEGREGQKQVKKFFK